MKKNHHFHVSHYLILLFCLSIGVITFIYFIGFPDRQFVTAIIFSMLYFIWGIVHHALEGDLHPKIMVEYLVISILAVLLLRGAIYR